MKRLSALLLSIFLPVLLDSLARADLSEVREIHYQMGTVLDIRIWHPHPEEAKKILRRSVQEVHQLERVLSNYDPESSLSWLNKRAGRGRTTIPRELFEVLAVAVDLSAKTSGYFDVTVGPLVRLWRDAGERSHAPDPRMLNRARSLVGYQKLKLHGTNQVELAHKGMSVDLGGIGKGYAVDRVAQILKEAGVHRALVNFGESSIYALGTPPGEDGWKIGVRGIDGSLMGILRLGDQALSTSGSMGRSWVIGGKRYGHLINPKSGLPVTEARMATVVAPTATEAEALTKPLVLIGKEGLTLIKSFSQTEAILLLQDRGLMISEGFSAATGFQIIQKP